MNEVFKLLGTIGLNNKQANDGIDETTDKARTSSEKIVGFFKSAAAAIGTVFAVQKVVGFGKIAVEAAATAQAMQAQFEQVFGDSQTEAGETISGMAQQFGMLPNRIKPAFTATASMFKGLGLESGEAMQYAEKATGLAADAAAFFDKSFEDADGSLKSFIKGNYEGGEAIGLFANETQMAAWAAENLGLNWEDASEAEKQLARTEFAEAMMRNSGAAGQATRESEGYENQVGNLKQAFEDFKALVGAPMLDVVINGLQKATEWLQTAGTKVDEFRTWFGNLKTEVSESTAWTTLMQLLQPVFDGFNAFKDSMSQSTFLSDMSTKFGEIKDKILEIDFIKLAADVQAFIDKWMPLAAGIGAAAAAFGIYTFALGVKSAAETVAIITMYGLEAATALFGATMAFVTSPIGMVVIAIGLLVAAGVWLWQNWDTVKAKGMELWGVITNAFNGMWNSVSETMGNIMGKVSGVWDSVISYLSGINLFDIGSNIIQGLIDGVKGMAKSVVSSVENVVSDAIQGAKNLLGIKSPSRVFMEIGAYTGEGFEIGMQSMHDRVALAGEAMAAASIPRSNAKEFASSAFSQSENTKNSTINIYGMNLLDKGDQKTTLAQLEFMTGI